MAKKLSGLKKIQYNCNKATFLIEKKQLLDLTTREKWELMVHLEGCIICRIFEEQSIMINTMVRGLIHSSQYAGIKLDEAYKRKLQNRINEEMDKN